MSNQLQSSFSHPHFLHTHTHSLYTHSYTHFCPFRPFYTHFILIFYSLMSISNRRNDAEFYINIFINRTMKKEMHITRLLPEKIQPVRKHGSSLPGMVPDQKSTLLIFYCHHLIFYCPVLNLNRPISIFFQAVLNRNRSISNRNWPTSILNCLIPILNRSTSNRDYPISNRKRPIKNLNWSIPIFISPVSIQNWPISNQNRSISNWKSTIRILISPVLNWKSTILNRNRRMSAPNHAVRKSFFPDFKYIHYTFYYKLKNFAYD